MCLINSTLMFSVYLYSFDTCLVFSHLYTHVYKMKMCIQPILHKFVMYRCVQISDTFFVIYMYLCIQLWQCFYMDMCKCVQVCTSSICWSMFKDVQVYYKSYVSTYVHMYRCVQVMSTYVHMYRCVQMCTNRIYWPMYTYVQMCTGVYKLFLLTYVHM